MTRIGGLPTARGLLRKCRARARPIANGSNRRTPCPFGQCAGANPRGFPRVPFRSHSQAAGRARCLRWSRCTHRAHGARARKAREIRETCLWLVVSPPSGGKAVGRPGGPPLERPERRACRPLYDPFDPFEFCKTRESGDFSRTRKAPRRRQILISGRAPRRLHSLFCVRGFRHVFTVFAP